MPKDYLYYYRSVFRFITILPCFIPLPVIVYELYLSWLFKQPLIWNEAFTSLFVCGILGLIAGVGLFLKLKWARIISLALFLAGMLIWLVIFLIEITAHSAQRSTLSILLLIYAICITILLFVSNENIETELQPQKDPEDILDNDSARFQDL